MIVNLRCEAIDFHDMTGISQGPMIDMIFLQTRTTAYHGLYMKVPALAARVPITLGRCFVFQDALCIFKSLPYSRLPACLRACYYNVE